MIEIKDKSKCCGCTACKSICPKKCIEMVPDEEGFRYPHVNSEICNSCGACELVCPILNPKDCDNEDLHAYAMRTKSKADLKRSTSGGFTTPLAEWVFSQGGKVWAASYDKSWKVCHKEFESLNDVFRRSVGSKYVQSDLGSSFVEIKKELDSGNLVCFIGTTCQVYGLQSFLKKDYDNLITVDLVCHGVPSPKLWKKYIDYQQNKYKSKTKSINFRNKTYGYHSGTMLLEFENGKKYTGSARVDYMLKSFFTEISSRPSCYSCAFKNMHRISDFTIFDCWHAADLVCGLKDDDCGYTNVFVRSDKGNRILSQIKDKYDIYPVDAQKAVDLDGIMVLRSAVPHSKRADFYVGMDERTLPEQIMRFIPISTKDCLIERAKIVFYRLGIHQAVKKLLKK